LHEAFSSESSLKQFVFSESMLVLISKFFEFLFFLDTDLFLLLLILYLKKGLLSFINFISNDFMSLLYTICNFSILKFSVISNIIKTVLYPVLKTKDII
jgi:hypothetical protein